MKTNNIINNSLEDVIKSSSSKKSILFDLRKTWIAYLILAALIITSFFVRDLVQKNVDAEITGEFEKSYSSVVTRINNQYDRLYQLIRSSQGLYYERVQVVRDYFELTSSVPVKNTDAIICMVYAPKVLYADWLEFQYNARSQGYWPYHLNPPGVRDYYYPAEHIAIYRLNQERSAFDYGSLPVMKNAIEHAQTIDKIVSTEFFELRENLLSFAIIAPIFKRESDFSTPAGRDTNFQGSVVMEVDGVKFFETALAAVDTDDNTSDNTESAFSSDTSIVFWVVDKDSQGNDNVVFKSSNYSVFETTNYTPLLATEVPIKMSGLFFKQKRNIRQSRFNIPHIRSNFDFFFPSGKILI